MSSFEFVFGMISVVTSLALTRLLGGCVDLYRHAGHVRFSWRHACWTALAFMLLLGNWASFWRMHAMQAWHALDVLVPLLFVGVLYAFCDLVMPDHVGDGPLDLGEYHTRHGRRYKLVQLVFAVLAMIVIARNQPGFAAWLSASRFAILGAACSLVALLTRRAWLDTIVAFAMVALSATFMWTRLQDLSG